MSQEKIHLLDWSSIRPNPFNRLGGDPATRSGFDDKSLDELAESLRQHAPAKGVAGIVQPILVRPVQEGAGDYEIVYGERRWTAAGRISHKIKVPAIIRDYDDATAREVNAIENLQRVGLHFLEEAQGFQDLLDLPLAERYTVEKIAQRLGKGGKENKAAYVYARLKLLRLPPLARAACLNGKMNHSLALLVARIPDPKLAQQAAIEVLAPLHRTEEAAADPELEPMSCREAKQHIRDKYMVRLKDATFDIENADLLPVQYFVSTPGGTEGVTCSRDGEEPIIPVNRRCRAASSVGPPVQWNVWDGELGDECPHRTIAGPLSKSAAEAYVALVKSGVAIEVRRVNGGPCGSCPFRTGNLKALFTDVESVDVCTNPGCFKKKKEADFKRQAALAKEDGVTLLKDKAAGSLFLEGRLRETGTGYIDLADPFPGKSKKAWKTVLDESPNRAWQDQIVQARDDQKPPQVHLLLPVALAIEVARTTDTGEKLKPAAAEALAGPPAETPEDREAAERERIQRIAIARSAETEILTTLRSKLVKVKPDKKFWLFLLQPQLTANFCERHHLATPKQVTQFLKKRSEAELRAFTIEALFADWNVGYQGEFNDGFKQLCARFKVDWKKALKAAAH